MFELNVKCIEIFWIQIKNNTFSVSVNKIIKYEKYTFHLK